jgi:histidine triad (HIT) family protein
MTLFSKIVAGEIPADIVYQDDYVVAFRDIVPVAPVHVLIVPRAEIGGISTLPDEGDHMHILNAAKKVAEIEGIAASGYRLVINEGTDGGQTIPHLHAHLIGGRKMSWPPG